MTPASSAPSLPPIHPGDGSVGAGGSPTSPPTQSGHPRAPRAACGPLVPQTRAPRLHILGPTGFLIRKPRQLAAQIGAPHLFRFLRALSVWVWVSQTSSGASVCSRQDPRADHRLPASVSPASFHRGLPPALGTGRLSPGCRASEAVDPIPLRCPHVHPPQGPRRMSQVRTRGSACRFQSPLNL